jgi:mannose-6-phosphate isomerase-like protein (cupin superfamily)
MKIVHVDDVLPERMQQADGWAISEFRLPVTGEDGSSTTMFHATFRPGSVHAKHVHMKCDEIVAYMSGKGVIGQGRGRAEVSGGHRRWIPQGSEHFFFNETESEVALVIGFYANATSVDDTGYEHRGPVEPADLERPFQRPGDGTLVTVQQSPVADASACPGWAQAQVRMSVGSHTGAANALLDIDLPTGASIGPYRFPACEQIYAVVRGSGLIRAPQIETPVRSGHVVFVPAAAQIAVENTGDSEVLSLVGLLTGAGDLTEAQCQSL